MSTTLHDIVVELISQLPTFGIRMPDGLPELARRLDVLPLTWDMGGCMALRPTGEIVAWVWDEEGRMYLSGILCSTGIWHCSKVPPSIRPLCPSCRLGRRMPRLAVTAKGAARYPVYRKRSRGSSSASAEGPVGCPGAWSAS